MDCPEATPSRTLKRKPRMIFTSYQSTYPAIDEVSPDHLIKQPHTLRIVTIALESSTARATIATSQTSYNIPGLVVKTPETKTKLPFISVLPKASCPDFLLLRTERTRLWVVEQQKAAMNFKDFEHPDMLEEVITLQMAILKLDVEKLREETKELGAQLGTKNSVWDPREEE